MSSLNVFWLYFAFCISFIRTQTYSDERRGEKKNIKKTLYITRHEPITQAHIQHSTAQRVYITHKHDGARFYTQERKQNGNQNKREYIFS